jgi:Fe-S-cluster containining protein
MENQDKIRLDANIQTLYFTEGCDEGAGICMAVCCRNWNVPLSIAEQASRLYDSETLCLLTTRPCVKSDALCLNRRFRLKRKPDGSCMYLDDRSRCSIYSSRPSVCRTFTCENGWKLSPQAPDLKLDITGPGLEMGMLRERLRMDLVFVKNPAVEFKTSFYSKEDREIVLVVRKTEKCGTASLKAIYDNQAANDEVIRFIIASFDGAKDCAEVRQNVQTSFGIALEEKDFLDIVLLLYLENLILFKMVPSLKQ